MTDDVRHLAGWIPADQDKLEGWLQGHVRQVDEGGQRELRPSVAAFRELIEGDPVVGMLVQRMIEQHPENREYRARHIRDVDHLLALMDGVLDVAPEYGEENVTLPMGAVLDWSMGTPAGFAAFRDARVNAALRAILREWCEFLDSPASLYVLNDGPRGWKSAKAVADVGMEQFVHDPTDEHWGFRSWNDFFTRSFKEGQRPVAAPDDDAVVVAACESTPYALRGGAHERDRFWLKGQPYSLHEMLDGDDSVKRFVGGTVYQAFLSATDYHRWHAPIAGTVVTGWARCATRSARSWSAGSWVRICRRCRGCWPRPCWTEACGIWPIARRGGHCGRSSAGKAPGQGLVRRFWHPTGHPVGRPAPPPGPDRRYRRTTHRSRLANAQQMILERTRT